MAYRQKAMDDDLNTPMALAELQELRGAMLTSCFNDGFQPKARSEAREAFRSLGAVLRLISIGTGSVAVQSFKDAVELEGTFKIKR